MYFYISRGGQQYGPYTLSDLRNMAAQGNVFPADLVWSEATGAWTPIDQVLGTTPAPASPVSPVNKPADTTPSAPAVAQPQEAPPAVLSSTAYPSPPTMNWVVVLILTLLTCGLFGLIWMFVQAYFVKKIDPGNNAILLFVLALGLYFGGGIFAAITGSGDIGRLIAFGALVLILVGIFNMRTSLQHHYNQVEPIQLRLSGPMTVFFSVLYFQFHFTRIAVVKSQRAAAQ